MNKNIWIFIFFTLLLTNTIAQDSDSDDICKIDSDCDRLFVCKNGFCEHKELFPLASSEIIGALVICLVVGLANSGGFGGGPIIIPILMTFFNLTYKHGIKYAYLLIFFGGIGNYIINSQEMNKDTGGPIINYDLLLIAIPGLIVGALIGVKLNTILPDSILCLVLIIVLVNSLTKTFKKAREIYDKESKKIEEKQKLLEMENLEDIPKRESHYIPRLSAVFFKNNPVLREIFERDIVMYPKNKIFKMAMMLVIYIVLTILKGSKKIQSIIGLPYCGFGYWLIILLMIVIYMFLLKMFTKEITTAEEEKKLQKYYETCQLKNPELNDEKIKKIEISSLITGILGGMLGLGGGVILTPLWISMGFKPEEAASTSVFTVVFTSFASVFIVLYSKELSFGEIFFFGIIGFVASMVVAFVLKKLVEIYKRSSILIFVLGVIVLIALVMMPVLLIIKMIEEPSRIFHFNSPCHR